MKKSIFDEQTSKALMSWHNKVKKKGTPPAPRTRVLGGSPGDSPDHMPIGAMAAGIIAESSVEMVEGESPKDMTDIDLLTGP